MPSLVPKASFTRRSASAKCSSVKARMSIFVVIMFVPYIRSQQICCAALRLPTNPAPEIFFQLDFIADVDAVVADEWNRRLELSALLQGIDMDCCNHVAATLVETQRFDVVVCRDHPQTAAGIFPRLFFHCLNQR